MIEIYNVSSEDFIVSYFYSLHSKESIVLNIREQK